MSPRRRTLCFVLILLSFINSHVFVAGSPIGPVLTECCPTSASPPQLGNSLLTPQKGFPTQRFNEIFSCGSFPQGLPINTIATPNYGIPKPNPFTSYSTYLSPAEISNTLNIFEQPITGALAYPSDIESSTLIENYLPITQTIQVEGFAPTANIAEIYQTPITVQTSSMPLLSPFISVAQPRPKILPSQNTIQEICTPNILLAPCPQIVETEKATVCSVPVETTNLNIPFCDSGCSGQQLPVTLQINMASPWFPEPTIAVISQSALAPSPSPCSSFNYASPPTPPMIVMEKSKSKWKSILPILMLTLFDGGCGNNCGGGCASSQCSSSTPIPFPIVIPTSSPIITRPRGKGKSKAPSGSEQKKEKTT